MGPAFHAYSWKSAPTETRIVTDQRDYNIVVIVADAYRRDALSVFDQDYPYTPRLHRRMRSWYRFPRCFSSAPWTLPSCSSILSGLHASTHGYFFQNRPFGRPTLADYLGARYHRIGVVNNGNLTEFSGLHTGFDEYHHVVDHDGPFAKAREFLSRDGGARPFLLFLHTNLPHDYFRMESRQYYEACFPGRGGWFSMAPHLISWSGLSADQRARIRSFYDSCVARMDEQLSRLLAGIDLDRTIVCFVADHGEGLDYARRRIHHGGRLHNDLINVPLLISLPPGAPAAHHEALRAAQRSSVSTSDIVPTLLALAGAPLPANLDGVSLLRPGSSPRALPSEDRRYLYRATGERVNVNRKGKHTSRIRRLKNRLTRHTLARRINLKGHIQDPYKLIVTTYAHSRAIPGPLVDAVLRRYGFVAPRAVRLHHDNNLVMAFELFQMDDDPGETVNLLAECPPTALGRALDDVMSGVADVPIVVGERTYRLGDVFGPLSPSALPRPTPRSGTAAPR